MTLPDQLSIPSKPLILHEDQVHVTLTVECSVQRGMHSERDLNLPFSIHKWLL